MEKPPDSNVSGQHQPGGRGDQGLGAETRGARDTMPSLRALDELQRRIDQKLAFEHAAMDDLLRRLRASA